MEPDEGKPLDHKTFFIVGTGTDVGKTLVSLLLMHYFFRQGKQPFYIKPFQTGCADARDPASDAHRVYASLPQLDSKDPSDSVLYCMRSPKAPFFAARDQGMAIDTQGVLALIKDKAARHDALIVEAAGGLFVPVTEQSLILDLVEASGARPLVVARAGLGTINHTLLTIEALTHRGMVRPGLVFVQPPGDATPPGMIEENIEAVALFSGIRGAGLIPPIADFRNPDPQVFRVIERLIR